MIAPPAGGPIITQQLQTDEVYRVNTVCNLWCVPIIAESWLNVSWRKLDHANRVVIEFYTSFTVKIVYDVHLKNYIAITKPYE